MKIGPTANGLLGEDLMLPTVTLTYQVEQSNDHNIIRILRRYQSEHDCVAAVECTVRSVDPAVSLGCC